MHTMDAQTVASVTRPLSLTGKMFSDQDIEVNVWFCCLESFFFLSGFCCSHFFCVLSGNFTASLLEFSPELCCPEGPPANPASSDPCGSHRSLHMVASIEQALSPFCCIHTPPTLPALAFRTLWLLTPAARVTPTCGKWSRVLF